MKKIVVLFLMFPFLGISQIDTSTILQSPLIEESFTNFDSLVIKNCIVYNKDKSIFTGTAFFIDYLSRYYFIKQDLDKPKLVLKIMNFIDGLKSRMSKIIDPINGAIIKDITLKETSSFLRRKTISF